MGFRGARHLMEQVVNQVYINLFIETKGQLEAHISAGEVQWAAPAQEALGKIAQMIPHFIRTKSVKKLQHKAEEQAKREPSEGTLEILKAVAEQYTPTRFKTKFLEVFEPGQEHFAEQKSQQPDWSALPLTMEWDEKARELLKLVPPEFTARAVAGTESYARKHGYKGITGEVVEAYRKELGF